MFCVGVAEVNHRNAWSQNKVRKTVPSGGRGKQRRARKHL
jgi:hypothetical protein